MSLPRVLSIQSHTVHGYVGNKSAVFPLQLLGFEVDPINSVQFSNHTGYAGGFRGEVLQGAQLTALVDGLHSNGLLEGYACVLTGYIGSASFLHAVLDVLRRLRAASPEVAYFCDPVMGDGGKLYVPAELLAIYRDQVVPLAAVLTPNGYEAELLTGRSILSEAEARGACEALHERGPHTVVITSIALPGRDDELLMLASRRDGAASRQWALRLPRLRQDFTGTGDLTAALLLAWMQRLPRAEQLGEVLERVGASLQAVLAHTQAAGRSEICLIQSQAELREPVVSHRAEPLPQAAGGS